MTLRLISGGQSSPIAFLLDSVHDRTGRRRLEGLVSAITADRDQVLARQGDVSRELLVVCDGTIKLWKSLPDGRRQIVAFRGRGDPVTLHRRDTPWPVTAQAVSSSKLYRLEWEALQPLASRYPAIDQVLFDLACDEVTSTQNRILMLGRMTIEEKLASFILEFCRPTGSPSSLNRDVHLPMRRHDIADYLGLTTESISRGLSRLKRNHIIAMPRPARLVVLNRPALEALAMGHTALKDDASTRAPRGVYA